MNFQQLLTAQEQKSHCVLQGQRQLQSIHLCIVDCGHFPNAPLAEFLPLPAGARVHLVASRDPQGQDERLLFRVIGGAVAGARLAAV